MSRDVCQRITFYTRFVWPLSFDSFTAFSMALLLPLQHCYCFSDFQSRPNIATINTLPLPLPLEMPLLHCNSHPIIAVVMIVVLPLLPHCPFFFRRLHQMCLSLPLPSQHYYCHCCVNIPALELLSLSPLPLPYCDYYITIPITISTFLLLSITAFLLRW